MISTKITCTLGPSCGTEADILRLARAGMSVARINLSHGTRDQHRKTIQTLHSVNKTLASHASHPTCIGILLDTKGAEVRTGIVDTPLQIAKDEDVVFSPVPVPGEKRQVVIVNHKHFNKDAKQAETILLDNGKLTFELVSINKNGTVVARAREDGSIGSRRHVNLPGANLDMPSLTDKDWEDIDQGTTEGVDFLGLSFIREAREIEEVRNHLRKKKRTAQIIAKVETRQAVANMESIIEASDGIMVARGDLGAEVPFERIPVIQDQLVSLSRIAGKPVIVATHMLESMCENPMPTRAEVTDIAHAASTFTDMTMLSGETASGKHPLASLEAMVRVLTATETHLEGMRRMVDAPVRTEREARAQAAVTLALSTNASAIVVMSRTGQNVRDICRYRPRLPVIGFTPDIETQRSLQLTYGVIPLMIDFNKDPEKTVTEAFAMARERKLLKRGEKCVLLSDSKAHDLTVSTVQIRTIA